MTYPQIFAVIGCFAFVAGVSEFIGRSKDEISESLSGVLFIVLILLGSFTASHVVSGSVAPQWALSDSEVYAVVGTPTRSTTEKNKFIVVLQGSGEKEHIYLVESIPPSGFKAIKDEVGQEFYVPEKFASPKL